MLLQRALPGLHGRQEGIGRRRRLRQPRCRHRSRQRVRAPTTRPHASTPAIATAKVRAVLPIGDELRIERLQWCDTDRTAVRWLRNVRAGPDLELRSVRVCRKLLRHFSCRRQRLHSERVLRQRQPLSPQARYPARVACAMRSARAASASKGSAATAPAMVSVRPARPPTRLRERTGCVTSPRTAPIRAAAAMTMGRSPANTTASATGQGLADSMRR